MVAEMQAQLDEPRAASQTSCKLIVASVHGNGAVGVTS
jgi:hypothetical protein